MSRSLTTAMANAIAASDVRPFVLLEAEFTSGTIRVWTGLGDLTWNAQTWDGIGTLLDITPIDESDEVKAQGITLRLKGVSPADLARVLLELRSGRPGILRLGAFDSAGAIIASPKIIFRGRLDLAEINDENLEEPVIELGYEHELIDLERPREWRFTDEHQKLLFPGDTGLRYIASLQDKEIIWGRKR